MTDNDDLYADLDGAVAEALELRMGARLPASDASTGQLLDALLDVRRCLDRVEALLVSTLTLRNWVARQHTAVRNEVDDAWDKAAVDGRNAGIRDEYSSARERAAAANLAVADLRRVERIADRKLKRCEEATEFIRLRLRGLQEVRQDLLAIMKIRQFESALER